MKDFKPRFAELAKLWNKVEGRVKDSETFRGEANLAAVNEMRYAGRRLVDALDASYNGGTEEYIEEQLIIAKNYLVNADHDVTDAICFVVMRRVVKVIKVHGKNKIARFCPDFWKIYPSIVECQKIMSGSREDRQTRIPEYERIANDFVPKFRALYDVLLRTKELRVLDDKEELRALRRRVHWITIITIVGSVFSIIAVFIALFTWVYPWSDFLRLVWY